MSTFRNKNKYAVLLYFIIYLHENLLLYIL